MTSARINREGPEKGRSGGEGIKAPNSLYGVLGDPLAIPSISLDLIQYLNGAFPDALKLVSQLGSVEAANGARAVIEHLVEVYQEQQEPDYVYGRKQISSTAGPSAGPAAAASG